jgi:hypothetical protein
MGQTGENPFGSATSDSVSLKGDIYGEQDEWYNVARGVLSNCVLALEYSDVPESSAEGFGTLVIEVLSNDEMEAREKPDSFYGSYGWRVS